MIWLILDGVANIDQRNVCQHLGYHIGVVISPSQGYVLEVSSLVVWYASLRVYVLEVSSLLIWYSSQSGTSTSGFQLFICHYYNDKEIT